MKKLKVVGILAAVVLIGSVISIPLINNHTAYKVEKALCEILLPEETELIESLSQAGKLTGNGNGFEVICLWKNWMLTIQVTEVMNGNVWWKLRKGSPLR